MAAGSHLVFFSNFTISGCGPVAGAIMMLCIKFGPDRINSSKVIEIFYPIGNTLRVPQTCFLGVLGVKTENFIFLNPKRHYLIRRNTSFDVFRVKIGSAVRPYPS